MQLELKELRRTLGITFVFVPHDQEEALLHVHRVAVMNEGDQRAARLPERHSMKSQKPFVARFVARSTPSRAG
jgi:spermidine/putrescine transport system ATP-binding protein